MKKRFCNIAFGFIFCLLMAFVLCPADIQANTNGFETDSDGYKLIHTYEELRTAARWATWEDQFRLANDITQSDSKNNLELVINAGHMSLDLNGYTIERKAASIDQCLFTVQNSGVLELFDSSDGQTGTCKFSNDVINSTVSVINNSGGDLFIYGGNYILGDKGSYDGAVLFLESGTTIIEGGVFDSRSGGRSIHVCQYNYMIDVPVTYIYGGRFLSKYSNICVDPTGKFVSNGVPYSPVFVMGGEFYISKREGNSGGFSYCNNGWGDVIVANGTIPAYSLNGSRDVTYIPNVNKTVEHIDGIGNGFDYYHVTPSAMIASDSLTVRERLYNMVTKQWYERYLKGQFSTIQDMYGEFMKDYVNELPTITVDSYDSTSPDLWISGLQEGDTVKWYGAYDYDGTTATWQPVKGHETDTKPWNFGIRPDGETTHYVKAVVTRKDGTSYEDIIRICYEEWIKTLQGNTSISMNSVRYGNTVYASVFDTPSWQDKSTYKFEWKVDGITKGTGQTFKIDKAEYVGKELSCTVTSSKYSGSLVTPAKIVGKALNTEQPIRPSAVYNTSSKEIQLSNLQADQEYLFTDKVKAEDLTEDDWVWAKHPDDEEAFYRLSFINMQGYEGKEIYIYSRLEETDTHQAGQKVDRVPLLLDQKVYLKDIHFVDEINGTIYIPFTEKGQSVTLKYSLDPINANTWNTFTWIPVSWPVKILFPESGVNPTQNNDGRLVLSLQGVGGTTLIAYTSNGTQFKKVSIVVYDPENPSIGTANVVRPMPDQTVEVDTFFTPEMPEFIPQVPESMELLWYFTESTQSGYKTYTSSLVGEIIPETGEIYTLGTGTADVSLVKRSGNGVYVLDTFKLTVVDYGSFVPVEKINLSRNNVAIQVSEVFNLNAKVVPSNASNIDEVWTSSNPSIVKVEQNGQLIGMKEGTAKVTVTIDGKKASCNVTVSKNPVFNGGEEMPQENPFTDVKETDYFFGPVLWAVDQGITTGTSKTAFSPEAICTRAQAVTFLWRSIGQPEPKSNNNPFSDVKSSEYYYKAVLWAVENGITNGVSATQFKPDDYCTRGQIVTFLWRLNGLPTILANNPFKDVLESEYYYKAVLWAVNKNITNGTTPNTFEPNSKCTRGQIVTFLYRSESN